MRDDPQLDPLELFVAEIIEDVLRRDFERDPGERTVRDARDGSHLRVDATYEGVGIALEITSLQDSSLNAAAAEVRKIERRLTAFAREHDLGGWTVGVIASADLPAIEQAIRPIMKERRTFAPLGYSAKDLQRAEADGQLSEFLARHRMLHQLGLSLLHHAPERTSVAFAVSTAGFQITGFTELLEQAIADNVDKLREARPRECHLAILVVRWDVSNESSETTPPHLPDDVDVLWVVHPGRGSAGAEVWSLHRGSASWRVHASD